MKANELRIGNLVTPAHESNCPVIKIKSFYENGVHAGLGVCYSYSLLLPIELTEEWLIKLGAKEHKSKGRYGYKYFLPMLDYIYVIERDFNKETSHFFGVEYTDCEGIEDQVFNFSFDLKYVHQLQNLYFALTGKELEMC